MWVKVCQKHIKSFSEVGNCLPHPPGTAGTVAPANDGNGFSRQGRIDFMSSRVGPYSGGSSYSIISWENVFGLDDVMLFAHGVVFVVVGGMQVSIPTGFGENVNHIRGNWS